MTLVVRARVVSTQSKTFSRLRIAIYVTDSHLKAPEPLPAFSRTFYLDLPAVCKLSASDFLLLQLITFECCTVSNLAGSSPPTSLSCASLAATINVAVIP